RAWRQIAAVSPVWRSGAGGHGKSVARRLAGIRPGGERGCTRPSAGCRALRQGLGGSRVQGVEGEPEHQLHHGRGPQNGRTDSAMDKVNASDAARISEAIEIWVGPVPNLGYDREAALVERFGKA